MCEGYQYIHHKAPHPPINFMGKNYVDNSYNVTVKVLRLELSVLFSAKLSMTANQCAASFIARILL